MRYRYRAGSAFELCFSLLSLLLLSSCGTPIQVGELRGVIKFDPVTPSILNYLTGNPAQPGGTVRAVNTASPATPPSTTTYSVAAGTAPPDLAQYLISSTVDSGGSTFSMRVDDVQFQNDARYRFGTVQPTFSGALISPSVTPSSQSTFDIKECPALASVRVRLIGPVQDLDALNELPASCIALAAVKENPVGTQFEPQARSAPIITTRTALRSNEGVSIPLLFRGGRSVAFTAACVLTTSQPGFPQNPSLPEGTVSFGAAAPSELIDSPCSGEPNVQIDIPVERAAGKLKGLIDVVGHTESLIRVALDQLPGFAILQDVTADAPPHQWQFDAVPTGQLKVSARALLDNGNAFLRFPVLDGPDRPTVNDQQTMDIGARFVAIPFTVQGSLSLRDPHPVSRLTNLVLNPFSSIAINPLTSYLRAEGDPTYASTPQGLGANGREGLSFGKLNGTFDSTARRWGLNASVLLVGLSPVTGLPDGTNTLPAPWKVNSYNLQFTEPNVFEQALNLTSISNNLMNSTANEQASLSPIDACFGEFSLTLQPPENLTAFAPKLEALSSTLQQLTDENGAPVFYGGNTTGTATAAPFTEENAASSVTVSMALPAFLRYQIRPSVSLRSQLSPASRVTLLSQSVPPAADGMIACGQRSHICSRIDQNGAIVSNLRAEVTAPEASCSPDSVQLGIFAESTGATLQTVTVTIGDQAPVQLCGGATPCQNPFQSQLPLGSNVIPGEHLVTVTATDNSGCIPVVSSRFVRIVERPQLVCRAPVVVQLRTGETTVPSERVADSLQASWNGSCPGSPLPPISDNRPASFPLGTTTVQFSANSNTTGAQQCNTPVTVMPPDACITFQSLPLGLLSSPTTIGDVEVRPLQGTNARIVDFYPPNQPDGQREVQVGGIEAQLPFSARWLRLQYAKANSIPLTVDGFDESGQLVNTWVSPSPQGHPEQEGIRLTRVIPSPRLRKLQIHSREGETLLMGLCYSLSPARSPQPGDIIIWPPR